MTPYGIARTPFLAVGKDHKVGPRGRIVAGRVGHDRIQAMDASASIGEEIRKWYALPKDHDFERVDVDLQIHPDGHLAVIPFEATLRGRRRRIPFESVAHPLSFNERDASILWKRQVREFASQNPRELPWVHSQLDLIVREHKGGQIANVLESDLLRASGALAMLGLQLGAYVGKHFDCAVSSFKFLKYPTYECPIEVKKRSSGFRYQMLRYKPLPRVVVLCMGDDLPSAPQHVDVLELDSLCTFVKGVRQGASA